MTSDEDFSAAYDGYTFEASFEHDEDAQSTELCPDGACKALTR